MKEELEQRRYIADLHFDNKVWVNNIKFCQDDIKIFEARLAEILQKNTSTDVRAMGEHFQNSFIRQREVMDILMHDINASEHEISEFAKDHPVALDHVYFKKNVSLEDRMVTFEKLWRELREEFMGYARKWM